MYLIQGITSNALQKQTLILQDGSSLALTIYFRPMQLGWFIDELVYKDFTLHGVRITNSPDILYQFKNILPFGLACYSSGNREPSQQQDFSSGASKLYILTQAEVTAYTEFLQGG